MRVYYITLLVFGYAQARLKLDPLVDTNQGLIKGLKADDGDYSMFLGIPYATVDKSNAFGISVPYPKFENVFEAYNDTAMCPHLEEFNYTIVGSLDCLNLNVYIPNKGKSTSKLPVVVWIHGGGFHIGAGGRFLYGPKYLVRHGVIVVTLNYRLGPYGFFCLDIPEVPGNQGLKDQLLALRWVKRNIAAFGGDDDKITIMGQSAGAASVEFHILSQQEELFNQAIIQSGSALAPWPLIPSNQMIPYKIAEKLGLQTDDIYTALSFLSNAKPNDVIKASSELSITYRACVEKEMKNVEAFIPNYPELSHIPKAKNTRILLGYNNQEELIAFMNRTEDYLKKSIHESINIMFDFDTELKVMEDIVRHFYFGDKKIDKESIWELIDFSSDFQFAHPAHRSIEKFVKYNSPSVHYYVFSYKGKRKSVMNTQCITEGGAAHSDEISYLFDVGYDVNIPSPEDQLMIDRMTTLWTNFIKCGDPTPETSGLLPVKWPPINENSFYYLDINSKLSVGTRPFHARLSFWDLFFQVNKQKLRAYKSQK